MTVDANFMYLDFHTATYSETHRIDIATLIPPNPNYPIYSHNASSTSVFRHVGSSLFYISNFNNTMGFKLLSDSFSDRPTSISGSWTGLGVSAALDV